MSEKEEFTAKFEGIELANLTHAVVDLARTDIPKMEKEGFDADYVTLCKKARVYLNLVLDGVIKKMEE